MFGVWNLLLFGLGLTSGCRPVKMRYLRRFGSYLEALSSDCLAETGGCLPVLEAPILDFSLFVVRAHILRFLGLLAVNEVTSRAPAVTR